MTGEEAINALARTLDDLDIHLQRSDATVKRSEKNRLSMLTIHGVAAMFIAPAFMAIGRDGMQGATWVVARLIPGSPYTLAVLLFAGGLVLAVATAYRAVWWEMLGLWILLSWYAIIAVSFGAAVVVWARHGMPDGPGKPSLYAPVLYSHFVAIMGVHLRTLHRIRRSRQRTH